MYEKYRPTSLSFINRRSSSNGCTGGSSSSQEVTNVGGLYVKTIGDKVPAWKEKVKRGQNASSSYLREEKTASIQESSIQASTVCNTKTGATSQTTLSGVYVPLNRTHSGLNTTDASINDAKMSFIHDVKRGYNSISGMTFLSELRQTLDMIRNPARGLRVGLDTWLERVQKLVRGYRCQPPTSRRCKDKLNADIASLWLEYAFGWSPLISDTKAGAEALARLINGEIRHTTVRGSGNDEQSMVSTGFSTPTGLPSPWRVVWTTNTTERSRVFYYGSVHAKANGPTLENAMHLFGFSLEEFVPTIWSLLPWSFLVDYFVNIGDVLEASFFDTSSIAWASRSEVNESIISTHGFMGKSHNVLSNWSVTGSPGSFTAVHKSFVRAADAGNLYPSVEISLPGEPQKWINMAALAANLTKIQSRISR